MFKTFALKKVLAWIAGINWDTFLKIVTVVKQAAILYPKGAVNTPDIEREVNLNRALFVSGQIVPLLGGSSKASSNLVTVIREIAVWFSRR